MATITEIKSQIKKARKISEANKIICLECINKCTYKSKTGVIYGLNCHPSMKNKNGIIMGCDEKGFFCHTHRCRSNSYKTPADIPVKDIKYIETTG